MSTKNEISERPINALADVPDFMLEDAQMGTDNMTRYIQPPRLLICQPTSKDPLNKYDQGTPLIMPNEQVIGKFVKANKHLEEPLIVVPIFFFPEFTLDNPRSIHSTKGAVRERSFDPNSEIARRSQNPALRETACPDDPSKPMKYNTRLNFIIYVLREDVAQSVLIQFKSAEYRQGMNFNSLIKARRRPIFGCQFALDISVRENDKGTWYGFNLSNPPVEAGPWVQNPDLYQMFKEEHLKLAEAHKLNAIDSSSDTDFEGDEQQNSEF